MRTCKIEGCNNIHSAKGLCREHYDREYRKMHKIKIAKRAKQYRQTHKTESTKYKKQYYQRNKENLAKYMKQYSKQYRQIHKKERAKYNKQWREDNKEKIKQWRQTLNGKMSMKAHCSKRRLLTSDLTLETIKRVYEHNILKYGTLTCILCGKPIEVGQDSLEHKTPLMREGSNNYDNLGVAHRICNYKKGTMTMEEWEVKNVRTCRRGRS